MSLTLTSYERVRRYITPSDNSLITDTPALRRELTNWIGVVSRMIENYLGFELDIKERIEFMDVKYNQTQYFT